MSSELWLPPGVAHLARRSTSDVDLTPFVRASQTLFGVGGQLTRPLAAWVHSQINAATDPHQVPLSALQAMGNHPIVYLAERTITQVELSAESVRYYASLVEFYTVYKLKRMDREAVHLYLLCFVRDRYQVPYIGKGLDVAIRNLLDTRKKPGFSWKSTGSGPRSKHDIKNMA